MTKEIEFNLNWNVEVILNEEGAEIWNGSVYADIHGSRDAGDIIKEQLWIIMKLFGSSVRMWKLPIQPPIKLFIEDDKLARRERIRINEDDEKPILKEPYANRIRRIHLRA